MGPTLRCHGFIFHGGNDSTTRLDRCRLNMAVFVKLNVQSPNLMTGGRTYIWKPSTTRGIYRGKLVFQGLWRPRNLMNLLCFLSIYGNSPTGEKHSLDSTHLFYMLHRFWSCSVFTWILNLLCARVSSWIHSIWWTYSWCKIHSTFCICFTLLYYVYFVLLPARSQLSIWICWMHEFCGTDLGSEESDSHHGAACLGEDRRDDRNHPCNLAKIKVDKFADLLSLTLLLWYLCFS